MFARTFSSPRIRAFDIKRPTSISRANLLAHITRLHASSRIFEENDACDRFDRRLGRNVDVWDRIYAKRMITFLEVSTILKQQSFVYVQQANGRSK
jgi:hypothetical protein